MPTNKARLLCLGAFVLTMLPLREGFSQKSDPNVRELLDQVRLDTMLLQLETVAGRLPIVMNDSFQVWADASLWEAPDKPHQIWQPAGRYQYADRVWSNNDVATRYLANEFARYGLETSIQSGAPEHDVRTENVLATIRGVAEPEKTVVVSAHYDSVPTSPGADDNGSGTVAVLEIARVLAGRQMPYSVLFALWDSEEIGLFGSKVFADRASAENRDIIGLVNMDMIGWDGDEDQVVQIHADYFSLSLAERTMDAVSRYDLPLTPQIVLPGTSRSDQKSFWEAGYDAILLIEELGSDFNPYYHSPEDLPDHLAPAYLESVTRLGLAVAVELATSGRLVNIASESPMRNWGLHDVYPNPIQDSGRLTYSLSNAGLVRFSLYDILGRRVSTLFEGFRGAGTHTESWQPLSGISGGVYLLRMETGQGSKVRTIRVAK